jgi:F-type H+-transporting ATPase subunit beta
VLVLETQQLTGEDTVRAISMESTDGLSRGTEVVGQGQPISMPVGDAVKGRLFNVVGAPIDGMKPVNTGKTCPSTARHRNSRTSPPVPRSSSRGSR